MEEEITEGKLFGTFERYDDFLRLQQGLLAVDIAVEPDQDEDRNEDALLKKLYEMLDEYQEQSYLLDPFLEQLVVPVAECLKSHAKASVSASGMVPAHRIDRVSRLLYQYIKCRGYKTIIRFFPHEIADMSIGLDYMLMSNGSIQNLSMWSLRYVVLLWLSLICMIPFDLDQLDEPNRIGQTADAVESLAKVYLGKAGLEREGSTVLLSRFYTRKDTRSRFHAFLAWSNTVLRSSTDLFMSIGLLQVLCEVVKSGPAEQVQAKIPEFFGIGKSIEHFPALENNTIIRKLKIKLLSRLALRLLPANGRMARKGRNLTGFMSYEQLLNSDDIEVPGDVEIVLEELFKGLQDRDTIVRWSAAKGTARVAERLPADFSDQVLDTITGLFAIHSVAAANLYDLPAVAESTWHGACLASAEMARRGLITAEKLTGLIHWLAKALYFDIRKGAHSIGSNVRDAAAYVLWALARTQEASALAAHASDLACRLVTVSLYDREIHIRRAASAAFQEHVGRMSLFPHGIDVLRKTDFYAVSVRRNSFLVAAPQVAEHMEYRSFLINHILTVTLRHWDPSMRQLGAQSLQAICQLDLSVLGPECAQRAAQLLDSIDVADIHGGLLALTELASAYQNSAKEDRLHESGHQIFLSLARISQDIVQAPRNELVTAAACRFIASSISTTEIPIKQDASVPHWRKIIDVGLRHRKSTVQEAAAEAMAAVSKLDNGLIGGADFTLTREFRTGPSSMQQSLGRFLGVLDYDAYPHGLLRAIQCLLESVNSASPQRMMNVEARCNCYLAMPQILVTSIPRLSEHMSPLLVCELFDALLDGLQDYTLDERGDVGSWIRMACIRGLTTFVEVMFSNAATIPDFKEYLPAAKYHAAISGILRQGVERLDNVRQVAGAHIVRLLSLPLLVVSESDPWRIEGESLMRDLFMSDDENDGWKDGAWLFPRVVKLLEVKKYRSSILAGLVGSVGTKTDSTRTPVSSSLVAYAHALPIKPSDSSSYDLMNFVLDLIEHAKSHITSNAVVVPVFQTFNLLVEGDALDRLAEDDDGLRSLNGLLRLALRNISRLKSVPRILESMKLTVNLLPFSGLSHTCVPWLADFLAHPFPKVRTDTAECLYLVLQSKDLQWDIDEAENILLETEWSSTDIGIAKEAAQQIILLFSGDVS